VEAGCTRVTHAPCSLLCVDSVYSSPAGQPITAAGFRREGTPAPGEARNKPNFQASGTDALRGSPGVSSEDSSPATPPPHTHTRAHTHTQVCTALPHTCSSTRAGTRP
jgi:hypothetical protein